MLNDKNYKDFLCEISENNNYQIDEIIFMLIPNQPRAISIEEFCEIANKLKINYYIASNFLQAFARINQLSSQLTLLTGSLYLVAEFLKNYDVD